MAGSHVICPFVTSLKKESSLCPKNLDLCKYSSFIISFLLSFSGSGKSYLAKMLRDLEVENGGTAPRIHSMDEYFMTEVDKVLSCYLT